MTSTLNDHLTRHLARYFDLEAETPSISTSGVVYFGKIDYLGRTGRWRADINVDMAWKFLSYGSCCCLCGTRPLLPSHVIMELLLCQVFNVPNFNVYLCPPADPFSYTLFLGYWVFIAPSASILCSLDMTVFVMLSCSRLKYLLMLRFQVPCYAWHIYYASCVIIKLHPHHLNIRKMSFQFPRLESDVSRFPEAWKTENLEICRVPDSCLYKIKANVTFARFFGISIDLQRSPRLLSFTVETLTAGARSKFGKRSQILRSVTGNWDRFLAKFLSAWQTSGYNLTTASRGLSVDRT